MSSKKSPPSLYDLANWCSELHADDWKFLQQSVNDKNPLLRMMDATYHLTKQMQELESRLTSKMADALADSEARILEAVSSSQDTIVKFWNSPTASATEAESESESEAKEFADTTPPRARRFKVLVYGLVGAQRQSITEAFVNQQALEIRAAERTSRPPVGDFDLVVCSKFIPHSATDSLKARNPQCKVIFAGGGTSSIIREINGVLSSL